MAGVISASESSWPGPFTGLSPRCFTKLVTALWREGADAVRKGRPWILPLEDRVLLVAAYWRTSRAWEESGAKAAVGKTTTIADGGYPGTGLVTPHRRRHGEELPDWKQEHKKSHKRARVRVEHSFARMKGWKILRDCRLKGDGVHHAVRGIARLHNVALAG